MPSNHFHHQVQLALMEIHQGGSARPTVYRPRSHDFTDEDWNIMTAGRAETALEEARANLAYALSPESIELWMKPKFFRSAYSSVAASLVGHLMMPTKVDDPHLQLFLDVVRSATYLERWAIAEAMEATWYYLLPAGRTVSEAFAQHGIPLRSVAH